MHHLAQINISRLKYPVDHPQIAEFVDNLDYINRLAEKSPGFIWRLKDASGNATDINPFSDPMIIINMSVWENVASLKAFAFYTEHIQFMRKRNQWFEKLNGPNMAMWWIEPRHVPTVEEAKMRLQLLEESGDSPQAFTFKSTFDPPAEKV